MAERRVADREELRRLHGKIGTAMPRLIGHFHDDAVRSITAIERALHAAKPVAMTIPAQTLKDDALQFGAGPLATLCDSVETGARRWAETRTRPEALVTDIAELRPLLERTMVALAFEAGVKPPATPASAPPATPAGRPVFGRKLAG